MMTLVEALSTICLSGGFGGVVSYMVYHAYDDEGRFKEKIPAISWSNTPSIVAHGVIGVAGALAVQIIVLAMRFYDSLSDVSDNRALSARIFLISMSLIGGFSARAFLNKISSSIEKKIDEIDRKSDRALEKANEAGEQSDTVVEQVKLSNMLREGAAPKDVNYVISVCDLHISNDPSHSGFYILKARAQRLGGNFRDAVRTLEAYLNRRGEVSVKDREMHTAHYNVACYSNLLHRSSKEAAPRTNALVNLKMSFRYSVRLEEDVLYANDDPDVSDLMIDNTVIEYLARLTNLPGTSTEMEVKRPKAYPKPQPDSKAVDLPAES